jgi:hypothetical protein
VSRPGLLAPEAGPVTQRLIHRPALYALDGTDQASHEEQASMIRRNNHLAQNNHACNDRPGCVVERASSA